MAFFAELGTSECGAKQPADGRQEEEELAGAPSADEPLSGTRDFAKGADDVGNSTDHFANSFERIAIAPANSPAIQFDTLCRCIWDNRRDGTNQALAELPPPICCSAHVIGPTSLCRSRLCQKSRKGGLLTATLEPPIVAAAQQHLRELRLRRQDGAGPAEACRDWEAFYRICNLHVRRAIAKYRIPRCDIDDYSQEAWTEITASLVQFEYDPARGPFESWLQIVVQRTVWRLKTRTDHSTSLRVDLDLSRLLSRRNLESPARLNRRELSESVRDAVRAFRACVSGLSYRAFVLRYLEDRTSIEIGELLNVSPQYVRVLNLRAIPKFRRFFAASEKRRTTAAAEADLSPKAAIAPAPRRPKPR